jgi:hypothetical protein
MTVEVEAYSGYKADERPLRFRLGERWVAVVEIADRWYDPEAVYFRVKAEDGDTYILRHDETGGAWSLEAFRKS